MTNIMTNAQIDTYYNNMTSPYGAQPIHDPIPTTTTSTTSTTADWTAIANPCAFVVCPNYFRNKVINGTCKCRPNRRPQRPRKRRHWEMIPRN